MTAPAMIKRLPSSTASSNDATIGALARRALHALLVAGEALAGMPSTPARSRAVERIDALRDELERAIAGQHHSEESQP